ncbi:TRAFAC clade GTPase domain-containing protein [Dactylosporangium darangshiense]|uniref:TRAFAC clade GTPase domain-containing protein n=1 Tax=Dactylosporangium darangshiense TaxID=579108 RepID=UPI00362FD614
MAAPPGVPLSGQLTRLLNEDIDQVLVDVLTALARLAAVGVTHRAVGPDVIFWDGHHAHLAGLGLAALTGEPREPVGKAPWSSPEQRAGEGVIDPRDDVWSTAVLLGRMISGVPDDHPRPAHLGHRYGALLGDMLEPLAARRPTAVEVLARLSVRAPIGDPVEGDGGLAAARRRFDDLMAAKGSTPVARAAAEPVSPAPQPVVQPQRRGNLFRQPPPPPPPPPAPRPEFAPRRCYRCLDSVQWTGVDLRAVIDGKDQPIDVRTIVDPDKREARLRHAFQRCPNPSRDTPEHYLPAAYLRSGKPINIAVVGRSGAGKSHLLAGIMREIEGDALSEFGVLAGAVDIAWHSEFMEQQVSRLYDGLRALEHTQVVSDVDFTDGLVLSIAAQRRPLMFFDVAGETLMPQRQRSRAAQFLSAIDALLFVADPEPATVDSTFGAVLDRLSPRQGPDGKLDVPAAIVVTKSDLARFEEPVDRWIRSRSGGRAPIHWDRVVEESRDAYAYLQRRGRTGLLAPFARIRDCTLHFASATGAHEVNGEFPRGARPQRCLEPLLALLLQLGVLPPMAAGRPHELMRSGG